MSLSNHPAADFIFDTVGIGPASRRAQKPAIKGKGEGEGSGAVLDSVNKLKGANGFISAAQYTAADIALKAATAIQVWAETGAEDLDSGEGLGDRLFSLMAGIADQDMDGEISEAESEVIQTASESAAQYLIAKGIPEADAAALMVDFDNDLAESIQELVLTALPEGDDASADDIDNFVFGMGSDESMLDAAQYKEVIAFQDGKKILKNKRISGTVKRSSKQKIQTLKAQLKSHSAGAQAKRAKSVRARKAAGY